MQIDVYYLFIFVVSLCLALTLCQESAQKRNYVFFRCYFFRSRSSVNHKFRLKHKHLHYLTHNLEIYLVQMRSRLWSAFADEWYAGLNLCKSPVAGS